jgi:hypothetical protein
VDSKEHIIEYKAAPDIETENIPENEMIIGRIRHFSLKL